MQAVVMHETGGPEVLSYEEAERPEPGDGEVLIRVRAASVNPVDWKYRRGFVDRPLPAVLGSDVSGTVESSRAEGFAEGDEVFGMVASGGYAEFATASAAAIAKKPDGRDARAGGGDTRGGHDRVAGAVRPRRARARADGADRGRRGRGRPLRGPVRKARGRAGDRHRVGAQPRLRARARRRGVRGLHRAGGRRGGERRGRRVRHRRRGDDRVAPARRARGRHPRHDRRRAARGGGAESAACGRSCS